MFIYRNRQGQSTLEYAVVIAIVVGALLATQIYIKRGLQGRLKQASDDIGEQFSPGASTYDYTTTSTVTSTEQTLPVQSKTDPISGTGIITGLTTSTSNQTQSRTGTEYISRYDDTDEW